jgi:hypothetical protein
LSSSLESQIRISEFRQVLQIIEILVTTGGSFEFAQPGQGNKPKFSERHGISEKVLNRCVGKAGNEIVDVQKTQIGPEHHEMLGAYVRRCDWDEAFDPCFGIAFVADPAGANGLEHLKECRLRCGSAEKNDVRIFSGADVTVKIDGVAADDDERHAGAREGMHRFNRRRGIRRRHERFVFAGCGARSDGSLPGKRTAKQKRASVIQQIVPCAPRARTRSCSAWRDDGLFESLGRCCILSAIERTVGRWDGGVNFGDGGRCDLNIKSHPRKALR